MKLNGKAKSVHDLLPGHLLGVYRFAMHLCGDQHLAEDLTQEAMLRALRTLHTLNNPDAMRICTLGICTPLIVQVVPASQEPEAPTLVVIPCKYMLASDAQSILQQVFGDKDCRIAADIRTNSVLVSGSKSSVQVDINAETNKYYVLSSAPIGNQHSVFVVQLLDDF